LFFDQIKNIDGAFYADSFIFNQEMLNQVNSLNQADLLERIYYLGASDSNRLLDVRDDFAKDAGRLFKKTGKKPELNQLLKELKDKRANLADVELQFKKYEEFNSDLQNKGAQLKQKHAELVKLQKKQNKLATLQQELQSYKQLEVLENKKKPINFDSKNYQQAQMLIGQIQNLQKNISSLEQKIKHFSEISVDDADAKRVVQKKSELLQWQSEYKACMQRAEQIKDEEKQLLAITPDLQKVINLNPTQINDLRAEYQNLPKETANSKKANNNNLGKILLLTGGLLSVLGLTLLFSLGAQGLIALIIGIIIFCAGFYKQKAEQKQREVFIKQINSDKERMHNFKKKYGLDPDNLDLTNLLNQLNQYRSKETAKNSNDKQMKEINSNMLGLARVIENLLNKSINYNFTDLLNAINEIESELDKKRQRAEQRENLKSNLIETKQNLKELELKLNMILAQANVKTMDEYNDSYQMYLNQAKLDTQIDALKSSLEDHLDELQDLSKNPTTVKDREKQLDEKISSVEETVDDLQKRVAEVQVQMNNLSDSTAMFEAKQDLANTETQFENVSKDYLADLFTSKWVGRALDLASNERFPKMLKSAKEYLQLLTSGRYTDIQIDKKITVTRFDGKERAVKYLSRGTAEQLYFALKLAFVEQVRKQINLPILIDDSFVNFDDKRVGLIDQLLKKISKYNQVLIFTAQSNLVDKLQVKPLTFTKGNQNV
ncbi:MAG TPA: DNA repair protein, partial [Lactobacillus acetotolerans]|nr:DNA repair protein [Lactobacillus acetotolerans]